MLEKKKDLIKLGNYIRKVYRQGVKSIVVKKDVVIVNLESKEVRNFLTFLKTASHIRCSSLLDVWGVDYPDEDKRFEVNYYLLSLKNGFRIQVKVRVSEEDQLYSVTNIFSSAGWLEREVWDMYGVFFVEHPDLRRILTDYGFEGHPLRKDFPLSGYVEVRYDDGEKRIVIEPIEMMQEFRYFNFASPWEKEKINDKKL